MVARTDLAKPRRAVVEQAAAWHAELAADDCPDAVRENCERWIAADPAHRVAFQRMDDFAREAARHGAVERAAAEDGRARRRNRTTLLLVLLCGSAAMAGWTAWRTPALRAAIADQRTTVGEMRNTTLAAGDVLTLDTDSAADIDPAGRDVRLWRGAVMAKVRKGLPGNFVVRTGQGTARALGTTFSVSIEDDAAIVTVVESRVEACATAGNHACLSLGPGEVARLDAEGAHRAAGVDPLLASTWSDGLLVAEDEPLETVLRTLNRYRADPIRFDRSEIAGLRVTGSFPRTDTERALASITSALPVRVDRSPDGVRLRRR